MITAKDKNKFVITKEIKLTNQQAYKMSKLRDDKRKEYLLSHMGVQQSVPFRNIDSLFDLGDQLANKPKNSILHRFETLLNNEEDTLHRPTISNAETQWVGVEIECLVPGDDEGYSCSCDDGRNECDNCDGSGTVSLEDDNGNTYLPDCRSCGGDGTYECGECNGGGSQPSELHEKIRRKLRKAKIARCSVKHDGSLSEDGYAGVEITVLFDSRLGFKPIERVCEVLNAMGAIVNKTCGLHVHLDAKKIKYVDDVETKGAIIGHFLPVLKQLVPESRRVNNYCQMGVSSVDGERYYAVNLTAWTKHKTIEIRLHSGTTNANKIIQWVRLLTKIYNSKRRSPVLDFQTFIDVLKLDENAIEFWDRRFKKFNDDKFNDNETNGEDDQTSIAV